MTGCFPPLHVQNLVLALEFAPPAGFLITAVAPQNGRVLLLWTKVTGKKYTVESASSPPGAPWTPLATGLVPTE